MGFSIKQYMEALKMEKGIQEIVEGQQNVTETSMEAGYDVVHSPQDKIAPQSTDCHFYSRDLRAMNHALAVSGFLKPAFPKKSRLSESH